MVLSRLGSLSQTAVFYGVLWCVGFRAGVWREVVLLVVVDFGDSCVGVVMFGAVLRV